MTQTRGAHAGLLEGRSPPIDPAVSSRALNDQESHSTYRPAIDGLRALAVTLVVAFHAGIPSIPGGFVGVDVFFVISGFLITGLLIAEAESRSRISMSSFYARRARRLLPMASLVLATTVLATWLWMPTLQWASVSSDVGWATVFAENWHLAAESTDYWAANVGESPVLHFWSLSVEEQFYFVWPLLMILALVMVRIRGSKVARSSGGGVVPNRSRKLVITVASLLALVGLSSFLVSALTSATSGPWAYFGLQTRAWELAAGAGLALMVRRAPKIPDGVASIIAFVGLAVILTSAVMITEETTFPGTAAVFPVAGALLVLSVARGRSSCAANRLLSLPPIRYTGTISYSWYLWHWPFLVFAGILVTKPIEWATGRPETPWWAVTLAVCGSYLMAALTSRLIERPLRRSTWLAKSSQRSLGFAALSIATTIAIAFTILGNPWASSGRTTDSVNLSASEARLTAGLATDKTSPVLAGSDPLPTLTMTPGQALPWYGSPAECAAPLPPAADPAKCQLGDSKGKKTLVLIGDSHSGHWMPAFLELARKRHWRLYFWTAPGCPVIDVVRLENQSISEGCSNFSKDVAANINRLPQVDLLMISTSGAYGRSSDLLGDSSGMPLQSDQARQAAIEDGTKRTLSYLNEGVKNIRFMRDIPWGPARIPNCMSATSEPRACYFPKAGSAHLDSVQAEGIARAIKGDRRSGFIDPTDLVCPTEQCAVVDKYGAIVYADYNHLTAQFASHMWAALGSLIDPMMSTETWKSQPNGARLTSPSPEPARRGHQIG